MSWFEEAIARQQRAQRTDLSDQGGQDAHAIDPIKRQQQEVEAFNPLLTRLLSEYGEHVFGKNMFQKRFQVRLERPGKSIKPEKTWNWHWHLDSLVRNQRGLEVHPNFDSYGTLCGFSLLSGEKRIDLTSTDEAAFKDGLVALYLK